METFYGLTEREWCLVLLAVIFTIAGVVAICQVVNANMKKSQRKSERCPECGSWPYRIVGGDTLEDIVKRKLLEDETFDGNNKELLDWSVAMILFNHGENPTDRRRDKRCGDCGHEENGVAEFYKSVNIYDRYSHSEP